jgi:phage gp46-like protein
MTNSVLQSSHKPEAHDDVLRLADVDLEKISALLTAYGLSLKTVAAGNEIPGSYWGDEEAGLIGSELLVRADTPLHSILHETCHYICMDETRRTGIHTDAGGDYDEENAVCYLQILLADFIGQFGRMRMLTDMDRWGYSFRLGSAQAWFEGDADDALAWLLQKRLIDERQQPNWNLRKA